MLDVHSIPFPPIYSSENTNASLDRPHHKSNLQIRGGELDTFRTISHSAKKCKSESSTVHFALDGIYS